MVKAKTKINTKMIIKINGGGKSGSVVSVVVEGVSVVVEGVSVVVEVVVVVVVVVVDDCSSEEEDELELDDDDNELELDDDDEELELDDDEELELDDNGEICTSLESLSQSTLYFHSQTFSSRFQ